MKHDKLASSIENFITDKKYASGYNVDPSDLDTCYPPIVQSGGNYKLRFSVTSSEETNVHFGAIICSFGARYKQYCSNIVRTMLIDPSDKITVSSSTVLSKLLISYLIGWLITEHIRVLGGLGRSHSQPTERWSPTR